MYFKICLNNQQYTFQKGPKDIRYILLLNLICSCTRISSFVIVFSQRATPNNPSTKQNFLRCQRPDLRRQQSKLDLRHSGWRQSRSSRLATGCRRCCSRTRIVFRVVRWRNEIKFGLFTSVDVNLDEPGIGLRVVKPEISCQGKGVRTTKRSSKQKKWISVPLFTTKYNKYEIISRSFILFL